MSILSDHIRDFRIMRGFSQKQLGSKIHKSPNAVSNWEKGTTSPDVETLSTLCKILEVTPNQMLGWDACPELDEFLSRKQELLESIDDLLKQRAEIDTRIRQYSQLIYEKKTKQ